jgi:protein SCO1
VRRRTVLLAAIGATAALGAALAPPAPASAFESDELPFYAQADLRPRWDVASRWRNVGPVALTEASGQPFGSESFARGPTVVSFFWAGCATACPASIEQLRALTGKVRVLLISDQPLTDSAPVLADYRRRLSLPNDWQLATGDPATVYRFARAGLFTDVERRGPDGIPLHTERNYLIDRAGRIRGIYDAHSAADAVRLQTDIVRLSRPSGVASHLFPA